jgi:hypothetical protein
MDPTWMALANKAVGPLAGGIGKGLGDALGGGGPFVGGAATSGAYGTAFSKDGWVLNFGQGATVSPTVSTSKTSTDTAAAALAPVASQAGLSPVMLLAVLAFGGFVLLRRKA